MANIYISSTGAGTQDGSTLANAINGGNQTNLRNAIQGASASDVVRLIAGTYTITSTITVPSSVSILGWTAGDAEQSTYANVIITGVSGTTYSVNSPGTYDVSGLTLAAGSSGQILKHLTAKLFSQVIDAEAGRVKTVTIDDCLFEICRDCISVKGDYHSFTTSAVNTTNNTITTTSHGLSNGDRIRFVRNTTSAVLPGGLTEGTEYYVVNVSGDTFKVSNTSGGAAIDITSVGTSTCVWYRRAESTENSAGWTVSNCIIRNFAQTGWRRWYGCGAMTGENIECWGDDGTNYTSCTLDHTTDTFTSSSHGLSANEAIAFHFTTVPTGWPVDEAGRSGRWKLYYVKTVPTGDTFTISATSGGSQITAFSSNGTGITWHRSYATQSGGQTGFDSGYTSAGRHTADKDLTLTNVWGGEVSDKTTNASTGSNWQGDFIKSETDTTGTVNGGYARYCGDAGVDSKGAWTINNFVVNHSLQSYKSYASSLERLVLNNCLGIACHWQGGKQADPRLIGTLYNGFMTANNCTFFDIESGGLTSGSYYIVKYGNQSTPVISQIELNDCLYGFYDANCYSGTISKISDASTTASPNIVENSTTWYNDRGISSPGTNPVFVDNTDDNFTGTSTNWNSTIYGDTRGYYYDPGTPPDPGGDVTLLVANGANFSGVTIS